MEAGSSSGSTAPRESATPTADPTPRWWWAGIVAVVVGVTLLHYATSAEDETSHGVFRRLYYLPIVWAALAGGPRSGLAVAGAVTLAYVPHAFLMHHGQRDPGSSVDKLIEIILYFGVAALAGLLVQRERRARRRAAREALERAAAQADAARLDGLVHLTRGLAHEIRNPLGGIQGAIEILAEAVPSNVPQREMADIALRESARLSRVLTDFLAFASPRPPETSPFPIANVVHDVVSLLRSDAADRGVTLEAKVAESPVALGDADQVTQILLNLVRNGVEATPDGGRVEVTVSMPSGDTVAVDVRDSGPGVPPELASSIFDPYVTSKEEGTGLGLSIAALLASRQGGWVRHRASPTGGAVFELRLPVAVKEAPP